MLLASLLALSSLAVVLLAPSPALAVPAPKLDWKHCTNPAQKGFDCATARVPLDYRHPDRRTIHIAVIRHRATDPAHRLGTLFFNPGGPGSGTAALPGYVDYFPASLRARFDIVSWDPRGIGDSTAVRCFDSQEDEDRFLAGMIPGWSFPVGRAEKDKWIKRYRAFGRRCGRANGKLLRHVSTADGARDLNLLRRAEGERKLRYVGISYGTFLGATYANLFPSRVRALVLDGDVNPAAWTHRRLKANGGKFLGTFLRQHSDQGAARTLNAFLDLCGRADTAHCAFSAGSAAATRAKFATMLRRLRGRPRSAGITYAQLVSDTANVLYAVKPAAGTDWGAWARELQCVWRTGDTCQPLPAPAAGMPEQAYAIICSESPNPQPAAFRSLDSFAYQRSGPMGPWWSWQDEGCAGWPATAADPYAGPWDRLTANPVLVIGNTHDPATPYRGALAMTRQLARARLLTVDGYGHTALTNPSACAQRYESRYLIDGTLPPNGAVCRQDRQPFTGSP